MNQELDAAVYKTESAVCVAPRGRIVGESCASFRHVAETHLSHRIDQFIVNLSDVDFIDSAGLGVLVGLKGRCAEDKVEFLILDPVPQVAQVFAIARLDVIFNIVRGREAASIRERVQTEENQVVLRQAPAPGAAGVETLVAPALGDWRDRPNGQDEQTQISAFCREALEKVRLGEYPRAVELYQQALSLDPECLSALNNLAILYEKKPVWTVQAINTWEKVLALSRKLDDPKHCERAERRLRRMRALLSDRG